MKINLSTCIVVLAVLVDIEGAIGHGTVSLTNMVPADWAPGIEAWCNALAFMGTTIMGALAAPGMWTGKPMLQAAVKPVVMLAIIFTGLALLCGPAGAQQRRTTPPAPAAQPGFQLPIDPLGLNGRPPAGAQTGATPGGQVFHLTDQLIADVLPDLKYAAALAKASNNKITTPCLQAVLDMVTTWQAPLLGADGQPIPLPDKHLITDMERAAELLNALQPDSPLSLGCAATAQAVQKDVATLVGSILSGGALGLFKVAPLAGL